MTWNLILVVCWKNDKEETNVFHDGQDTDTQHVLDEDDIDEARRTWSLGKQIGLFAEKDEEAVAALIEGRKQKEGNMNNSRRKKSKNKRSLS